MVRQYRDEEWKVGSEMISGSHEITLWVSPDPSDYEVTRIDSPFKDGDRLIKVDRGDGVVLMFSTVDEITAMVTVLEEVTDAWFKNV